MGEEPARVAVGMLGSATGRRQLLACGRGTGHFAKRSGLRTEGHNTGKEGNERNGAIGTLGKVFVYWGTGLLRG